MKFISWKRGPRNAQLRGMSCQSACRPSTMSAEMSPLTNASLQNLTTPAGMSCGALHPVLSPVRGRHMRANLALEQLHILSTFGPRPRQQPHQQTRFLSRPARLSPRVPTRASDTVWSGSRGLETAGLASSAVSKSLRFSARARRRRRRCGSE